ncbi:hypothetical protein CY658_31785 [Variovorax sp. RO1]|nr:hypothetical protein CY658_31785 [Variovorax sp. RO1]
MLRRGVTRVDYFFVIHVAGDWRTAFLESLHASQLTGIAGSVVDADAFSAAREVEQFVEGDLS